MIRNSSINLNSFWAAILLSAGSFSVALPVNGITPFLLSLCLIYYLFSCKPKFNKTITFFVGFIFLYFLFSFLIIDDRTNSIKEYFVKFLFMGLSGLCLSQLAVSPEKVIKYTVVISIVLLPFSFRLDFNEDTGIMMGISYYIIKFINAIILAFLYRITFFSKKTFLQQIGLVALLIVYCLFFVSFASRAAILSILLFIVFSLIACSRKHTLLISLVIGAIGGVLYIYFFDILKVVSDMASNHGLNILAVDKMLYYLDDISNGRDELYKKGLYMINENPLFGNGIASFENRFNTIYIHSIWLQLLIEGGLFFFVPIAIIVFLSFRYIMIDNNNQVNRLFVAYLISISLVQLTFSETFWRLQYFWYYIGYTIQLYTSRNYKKYANG